MGSANQTSSTSPYRVGEWEVQPSACRIVRDGREVRLTPKSMSVLDYLATRPGQTITHEELLTAFWRGAISSPNAVHKSITELRHALGIGGSGSGGEPDYIETIPRRGYRLVASVRLRRDPAESVPTERRSVAVLRFRNADDDPGHDYLAEGVAAALLECLSQTPDLIVVDRDRALHHTIGNQSVAEIGRSLDAGYLLDGSVSQVGNRVRISAALHRVSDGELVYAYQDEARIADVLQMRDKVIASVLAALEIHLDERRTNDMRDRGTRSVEAYLAMLEADSFYRRIDQRSMQFAAVRARAAIALDPGFIGAYSLLAHVLQTLHSYTPDPAARQPMRREVAQIRDAVSKQDGGSQALLDIRRLEVQMSARSWRDVEETTRAAVWAEGIPHRVCSAYVEYANLLKSGRLFREAARYLDLYRQFDKDHPRGRLQRLDLTGLTLSPRRAISVYRKALTLSQNNIGMLTTLISHLALVGEYDEAESYLCRLEESDQSTLWSYAARLQVEALRGDWRAGSVELHRVLESPRANRFTRGIVHLIVGDVAAGVEVWRQELYDPAGRGAPALLYAVYTEKYYTAAVVDDPRYQDFLDEAGIGREWTAYLREKAAELAPITGIEPGDPAPQRVWSR